MGRVSLTESYDDRSVISKLNEMNKRVTENTTVVTAAEADAKASAQAAQETADRFAGSVGAVVQNANAQINASKAQVDQAKAEVDETVTTVAQAVQTANDASAVAQQSATTVATYDTRLTAIEEADTHNVKLEGNQNITGVKTVPTTATGVRDMQIANGTRIQNDLANYAQMMRLTGNQTFSGIKKAGGSGFFRKQSTSLTLNPPAHGTITDELYVMEDTSGVTAVQLFNSYTEGAQTIYQIATKYPFVENDKNKVTTGILWLATYADHVSLFLRFTDKNGSSHMKEIGRVNQTD